MNYKKYIVQQSLLLVGLLFLFSCGSGETDKTPVVQPNAISETKPSGPFPFYKNIEIRPGLAFEVVSWGKGVDSLGGYLILMSDSIKNNYKSFSVERKGVITDVWNMDLDHDGNPEIYVELLSKKNVKDLNVYEYAGNNFQKINFPPLGPVSKKVYAGNDKFMIKGGDLFRSFPMVNLEDTTKKTGSEKVLQYRLSGNSFSVSEVED